MTRLICGAQKLAVDFLKNDVLQENRTADFLLGTYTFTPIIGAHIPEKYTGGFNDSQEVP